LLGDPGAGRVGLAASEPHAPACSVMKNNT
jgi:hypothetical protein